MKRIIPILIFLFTLTANLTADEPLALTAENAVEYALEGNLSLKNSEITFRGIKREYQNSWNVFLPSLTGSGSLGYSDNLFSERAGAEVSEADKWNLSLGLSASLPLNWSAAPGLEITRLEYESGLISLDQARASIRREVLKGWYNLLTQEANIGLLEENAQLAESTLKTVQTKFDRGLVPETDLLEAGVNAGQLRNSVLNAQATYENALMEFLALLGLPEDTNVVLTGNLEAPKADINETTAMEAAALSPSVRILALNTRILEKTTETLVAGNLTPTLSLGVSWKESATAPFESSTYEDETWQDALSFSLSVSIPLDGFIPGSKSSTQIAANMDNVEAARNSYAQTLSSQRTTVRGLLNSLKNAERSSKVSLENYKLAQRNLELTQSAWKAGTRSLLEVGTSQTDLLEAGQNYLLSLYSWIGYLLDLEYILGTTIGDLK